MFAVIFTDALGGRIMRKCKTEAEGIKNLQTLKDTGARCGALYREPFHTTIDKKALISWFGGRGDYWTNVSAKDKKVADKRMK